MRHAGQETLRYRTNDPFLFCTRGQINDDKYWWPLPPYTGAYIMSPACDPPNTYGMKSIAISAALVACLYAPLAWSQCAPGVPSAGNPACIPPNQANSPYYQGDTAVPQQPNPQPQAVWADRWGAIVIDKMGKGQGTVTGYSNKSAAIDAAMKECISHGAPNCELMLTYHNQCAAVAWNPHNLATAGAPTESLAKSDAIKRCGETSCQIVYSACSMAERVR